MEPLACSSIVYRAMARKNWLDLGSRRILPAGPSPADEDGLSVNIESAQSCAAALRECFGMASLHVGRIRDIGLDVITDSPPHANIVGLPRSSDDRTQAERLASVLARQARLIDSP